VPLDPVIERALAELAPPPPVTDAAEARRRAGEAGIAFRRPRHEGLVSRDVPVPVEGGQITVRVIAPEGIATPAPCFVYLHGGGWIMGTLDNAEADCVLQADDVGAVICYVDYRLSPEHRFPVPHDDCVAAYRYVVEHADELGIDPQRVAIGGGSAGGNLAAAVAIAARDSGLPLPCLQLLEVPAVDLSLSSPSIEECGSGYWLTAAEVRQSVEHYLGEDGDRRDPRASPIFAELAGLPPALVLVAEYDPVRDDGERYAAALRAAGTDATCLRVLGQVHGSWGLPVTPAYGVVRDLRLAALRRAFEGAGAPAPKQTEVAAAQA
jgi:acetyl esterase